MRLTILRETQSPAPDATALALGALGWVLSDGPRAERVLSRTGLTADELRAGLDDPALLGAVLEFLCAHEPDLVAAAEVLNVTPAQLAAAREGLSK